MSCEQVEERLSAYLDAMLAPDESRAVTAHLQACPHCTTVLAELRQNDLLLTALPRAQPSAALYERLFSSPEIRELAETLVRQSMISYESTLPLEVLRLPAYKPGERAPSTPLPEGRMTTLPEKQVPDEDMQPRQLPVGDRISTSRPARKPEPEMLPLASPTLPLSFPTLRKQAPLTPLKIAVAVVLIVALGTAGLLSLSLRHQDTRTIVPQSISPPAAGPLTGQSSPLAAGTRLVLLRAGALWSVLTDGSKHQLERLTPPTVNVAAGWVVSPKLTGHAAGDLLAYIDTQSATVHTIRSDGQQDTVVPQMLLKTGMNVTTAWTSTTGAAILGSLVWSNDGSMLAFLADPTSSGQTHLSIYTRATNRVRAVSLGVAGSVTHVAWSPDDTRLACAVAEQGTLDMVDYHLQDGQTLDLSSLVASRGTHTNTLLTLAWSPSLNDPVVTWSLGSIGHITSVWVHHVGANGTLYPQRLARGEYLQALYSPKGDNGAGSWLLVATVEGRAGDIWRIGLTNTRLVPLSRGKQVSFVSWSPNGSTIFYLDGQNNGLGSGHLVDTLDGRDVLLAHPVAVRPAPAWSMDDQQLAYSDGAQTFIVSMPAGRQLTQLPLRGQATLFTWLPDAPQWMIVSLDDTTPGLYLIDIFHATSSLKLDRLGTSDPVQWTAIP